MGEVMEHGENRFTARVLMKRFFVAIAKTAIVCILFMTFSTFTIPFEGVRGPIFTMFAGFFIAFVFVIELLRGTILQHVVSIANSLIIVAYFAYIMNAGVINFTVEQINLMVDLRFFLAIFVLGSILGFAKSMLDLLNWLTKRDEKLLQFQVDSM